MTPEDEQAMLQARADLGDMRMLSLPLSGAVVPNYLKTPIRKCVKDLDKNVAAWHAIVPEEDLDLMIRSDGIGAGDSHRYGKNYRPDSLHQCTFCHSPGHVIKQCPLLPRRPSLSRISVPSNYGTNDRATFQIVSDSKGRRKKKKRLPVPLISTVQCADVQEDDPRMHERSMIAAYPLISERKHAISLLPALPKDDLKSSPVIPVRLSKSSSPAQKTGQRKASSIAHQQKSQADVHVKNDRAQRPRRAPMQLTDQPFWQSMKPQPKDMLDPAYTTPDNTRQQERRVTTENIKQSSKGYLQERSGGVPKHYNAIIFPAEIPKAEPSTQGKVLGKNDTDIDITDDDEDDCVSVYTDPALNFGVSETIAEDSIDERASKGRVQSDISTSSVESRRSKSTLARAKSLVSTPIELRQARARNRARRSKAIQSITDVPKHSNVEEEADLFDDVFELLTIEDTAEEEQRHSSSNSSVEVARAKYLFKIILDENCSIDMYDDDTPEQMCARICEARSIENEAIKADFLRKIETKFKKALQARLSA